MTQIFIDDQTGEVVKLNYFRDGEKVSLTPPNHSILHLIRFGAGLESAPHSSTQLHNHLFIIRRDECSSELKFISSFTREEIMWLVIGIFIISFVAASPLLIDAFGDMCKRRKPRVKKTQ